MAATETIEHNGVAVTVTNSWGARRDYRNAMMALGVQSEKGEIGGNELALRATELGEKLALASIVNVSGFEFADGAPFSIDVIDQLPDDIMHVVIGAVTGTRREREAPLGPAEPDNSSEATP